jgi:hypothetical protein
MKTRSLDRFFKRLGVGLELGLPQFIGELKCKPLLMSCLQMGCRGIWGSPTGKANFFDQFPPEIVQKSLQLLLTSPG